MRSVLILLALLNGLALNAYAQSSVSVLSDLSAAAREDIARLCLPLQYRDGADAYRACVKDEVATRSKQEVADTLSGAFSQLSFDDQYAIQQACGASNAQAQDRACMTQQLSALSALPAPALDTLPADEQYVLQQNCFQAQKNLGAAAYRLCQLDAVASVSNLPTPNYSALGAVERNALQLRCSNTQPSLSAYRACLNSGAALANKPQELETASQLLQSENLDLQSDATSGPVSNAARIASAPSTASTKFEPQLPITAGVKAEPSLAAAKPAVSVTSTVVTIDEQTQAQAQTNSQTNTQVNTQVNTQADDSGAKTPTDSGTSAQGGSASGNTGDTAVDADSSVNDGVNNELSEPTTSDNARILAQLQEQFETLKTSAIDAFANLSDQGKMLLAALVVMPIALLILLAGRARRDEDDDEEFAYARQDLKRQVRSVHSVPDSLDARERDDPIAASWAAEADTLFDDAPTLADETIALERPVERPVEKPRKRSWESQPETAAPSQPTKTAVAASAIATRPANGFAGWLDSQPDELRLTLAIEFLLYWMAYGDDRYEPAMKQKIFQTAEPSCHDIVKRWVLKQDVHAFADAVGWLQTHTTATQKEQIVRFLMAMLINGSTPSPLQNTLLRFLGDVFFLESPSVEEIFLQEFDAELPSVPRVDRIAWWDRQPSGVVTLWDARALKDSDPISQHAAQLGVVGRAGAEHIQVAYDQAMRRCEASRYNQLSEREHRLINSRHARLTQAKDELLEALA
jgi:hypothetical protein